MKLIQSDGVGGSLRKRILAFVGALVMVSLLGSGLTLYRITHVNRSLDAINRVAIPLGRSLVQLQADAEVYRREWERRLSVAGGGKAVRGIPSWLEDVVQSGIDRAGELLAQDVPWIEADQLQRWKEWLASVKEGMRAIQEDGKRLAVPRRVDQDGAGFERRFAENLDAWTRNIQWGSTEYDRALKQTFAASQTQMTELRTGLEVILTTVVLLSLLLLWLGERTLRPLAEITQLAAAIATRGLRRGDRARIPGAVEGRSDEISELTREFGRMATVLLEREKTVEIQKERLTESNRMLREMGELNRNVLNSIDSVLLVTDLEGRVTQCNPAAARFLEAGLDEIRGSLLSGWAPLRAFAGVDTWLHDLKGGSGESLRLEESTVNGRVLGGHLMPLRAESGAMLGAILVLEDLTDGLDLERRLRDAEKLAAVGQMSAQVAHEVRNPLHSIGLEAEMALEQATRLGSSPLKQSVQSILASVDRLDKITQNYLKLSRLSAGEKSVFDLGDLLEQVLATYACACEAQGVHVDWNRPSADHLLIRGDREILEHVLGNLLKNALQSGAQAIRFELKRLESGRIFLSIEDNGPGVSSSVRARIFTPFVTTKAQGTGLGLSFVKRGIDEHGGQITYKDLGDSGGRGACFEIVLPSAAPVQAVSAHGSLEIHV